MSAIMELVNFAVESLQVKWRGDELDLSQTPHRVGIDYSIFAEKKMDYLLKLSLFIKVTPVKEDKGYSIEARVSGIFSFPKNCPREDIPGMLLMNGNAMLYGILRGHIATVTGIFAPGRFMLPTLNIAEMVESIEARKQTMQKDKPQALKWASKAIKQRVHSKRGGIKS